jgi:hypothetical protein
MTSFASKVLALSALTMGMAAFAEGPGAAPAAPKVDRKDARKECKAEHPGAKGKDIKDCVKAKLGK